MVIIALYSTRKSQGGRHVKQKNSVFRSLILVTQFGISMLVPILVCTMIGAYLGRRFSMPILTVPLFLVGALAGFRNVWIMAKRTFEDKGKDNVKKNQ